MRQVLAKKIKRVLKQDYRGLYNLLINDSFIYRLKFCYGVMLKKKNPKFIIKN